MIKLVLTTIFSLGIILGATPVYAEEGIMTTSETAPEEDSTTNCIGGADTNCTTPIQENIDEPTDATILPISWNEGDNEESAAPDENCDLTDKCDEITEEDEEDDSEPAVWPMYVSLGAIGLVVVVFIVLNLFGGRKKK